MKKLGVLCLFLIIAIGAMGVAYASWSQDLSIHSAVTTGTWGNEVILNPSHDSYITSASATTNFGGANILMEGKTTSARQKALIQFDLSGIPSDATIESATLQLYATATGNQPDIVSMYRLLKPWSEYGVTWINADNDTFWGAAGASDNISDYDSIVLASTTIPVGGEDKWYDWTGSNFKSQVQKLVSGDTNYGWILYGGITGEQATTFSSLQDTNTANRPKLVITWNEP